MAIELPQGGLESPNWANNDELKAVNEKLDKLIHLFGGIENQLRSLNHNIVMNAKNAGSSYGR